MKKTVWDGTVRIEGGAVKKSTDRKWSEDRIVRRMEKDT